LANELFTRASLPVLHMWTYLNSPFDCVVRERRWPPTRDRKAEQRRKSPDHRVELDSQSLTARRPGWYHLILPEWSVDEPLMVDTGEGREDTARTRTDMLRSFYNRTRKQDGKRETDRRNGDCTPVQTISQNLSNFPLLCRKLIYRFTDRFSIKLDYLSDSEVWIGRWLICRCACAKNARLTFSQKLHEFEYVLRHSAVQCAL